MIIDTLMDPSLFSNMIEGAKYELVRLRSLLIGSLRLLKMFYFRADFRAVCIYVVFAFKLIMWKLAFFIAALFVYKSIFQCYFWKEKSAVSTCSTITTFDAELNSDCAEEENNIISTSNEPNDRQRKSTRITRKPIYYAK